MYRCFNLRIPPFDSIVKDYGDVVCNTQEVLRTQIKDMFAKRVSNDDALNGSEMLDNWFPQVDCDIFISHAHKDHDKALSLAGWLKDTFGLVAFVDSMIWGCARDLQLILDKKFSNGRLVNDMQVYDYNMSNYAASHVHMMLASSIMMMIDKSECIFLLNTPQSIKASETINHTQSPWIYHEILVSNLIRNKPPKRMIRDSATFTKIAKALTDGLMINHESDLSLFTDIDNNDLLAWSREVARKLPQPSLDVLYALHPVNRS